MAMNINTPGVRQLDDPSNDSAAPTASPGRYIRENDPYRLDARSDGPAFGSQPPGFAANNRTRERHYKEREARIATSQRDDRADLATLNDHNRAMGRDPLPADTSPSQVGWDIQREVLMAQNSGTQAAKERAAYTENGWTGPTRTQRQQATAQAFADHREGFVDAEQQKTLAARRLAVQQDPDSQAGSGTQYDPYKRQTPAQRTAAVAANFKPGSGDFISVTEGNNRAGSFRGADGSTNTLDVDRGAPITQGRGMVQNAAGKMVPIGEETQRLEAENERTAAPARVAAVEGRAYSDSIKSGQATTFDQAADVARRTSDDYKRHDPYFRQRSTQRPAFAGI